jgi:hypothetical protein
MEQIRSTPRFPGIGKRSNGVTASRHACVRACVAGRCVLHVCVRACTKIYQTHNQSKPVQASAVHCSAAWPLMSSVARRSPGNRRAVFHPAHYRLQQESEQWKALAFFRFHLPFTQQQCSIPTPPHRAYHILHSLISQPVLTTALAAHCTALRCTAHRFLWLTLARSLSATADLAPPAG